jgi:acyl-ACP thioesterase
VQDTSPAPRPARPAAGTGPGPFAADPPTGRVFAGRRTIRSTDVTPAGALRLDALARYLQDVAEDDVAATGWQASYGWLLRRCTVTARAYPRLGERLELRTFCSAAGPRWAQRTTTVAGPGGDVIQAVAIWAAVDLTTGVPRPLGEDFQRLYGEATGGRTVSARLWLPKPDVPDVPGRARGSAALVRDWPLRASDFDAAEHVNNTVHWAALEDVLAGLGWRPSTAELEYHRAIRPGVHPRLLTGPVTGPEVHAWLLDGTDRLASGRLAR